MRLSKETRFKIDLAWQKLRHQRDLVVKPWNTKTYGATGEKRPEGYVETDPLATEIHTDYVEHLEPYRSEFNRIIAEEIRKVPVRKDEMDVLTPDKLWVWGGPTPQWGGSMAEDTSVRGADFFGAENVVYVYGPTTEHMMDLHKKFKKVLCQVNSNCRTSGQQTGGSDEANAEELSRLSLQYPNIAGAMCDDVSVNYARVVLPDDFEKRYKALKKHNPELKMYGTFYTRELFAKDYSFIGPFMDVITLWLWDRDAILEYDAYMERVQELFPGKKVLQGIFIHDYGVDDTGKPAEVITYELDKARQYMKKGIVEGVCLLGDREIRKWPSTAECIREYLKKQ